MTEKGITCSILERISPLAVSVSPILIAKIYVRIGEFGSFQEEYIIFCPIEINYLVLKYINHL